MSQCVECVRYIYNSVLMPQHIQPIITSLDLGALLSYSICATEATTCLLLWTTQCPNQSSPIHQYIQCVLFRSRVDIGGTFVPSVCLVCTI